MLPKFSPLMTIISPGEPTEGSISEMTGFLFVERLTRLIIPKHRAIISTNVKSRTHANRLNSSP